MKPLQVGLVACLLAFVSLLAGCATTQTGSAERDYYSGYYNVSYWGDIPSVSGRKKVVIDLSDQRAYFYRGDMLMATSLVSTGREGHRTRPGNFRIQSKSRHHRSSLYGSYVNSSGDVVVANVDSRKDKRPSGTTYQGASMPYFMRFDGGIGMHAGFLPGYPASHGCVRMPMNMAKNFWSVVTVGTPVEVRR